MTAEEILDKNLYNKFDEVDRKTFLKAMREFAIEQLGEVLDRNTVGYVLIKKMDARINKKIKELKSSLT